MFESFFYNKGWRTLFLVVGLVSLAIPFIGCFFEGIDLDTAVILTEMERVAEGYVPYKTMHLNYPPLLFYFFSLLKSLFGISYGCLTFYRFINLVFILLTGIVVYYFCKKLSATSVVSFVCVWLYLASVLYSDGTFVIFEAMSIFWGIWSLYLCWTYTPLITLHYVLIGFLASLSFLVKQFGLGFLVLDILCLIVLLNRKKIVSVAGLIGGFLIPVFVCYLIWGEVFFESVLFNGYGTETAVMSGEDTSLLAKINQICSNLVFFCFKRYPFSLLTFVTIPVVIKGDKWKEMMILVLGLLGISLQFYFVPEGLHYFLYMIPFAVLMTAMVLSCVFAKPLTFITGACLAYTAVVIALGVFYSHVYVPVAKPHLRDEQYTNSKLLAKVVNSTQKTVWIVNTDIEYLYYLNNLMVPNLGNIGYATGQLEVTKDKQKKQVEDADVVLVSLVETAPYSFTNDMKDYLSGFPCDTINQAFVAYRKERRNQKW